MPCPRGSAWMPARTCSAIRADVKKPRPITAGTNEPHGGAICFSASPSALGRSSGSTKYQRKSWTSSGMLRKSSTHALPSRTAHFDGVVRITPTTEPSTSAITHAHAAVASVQPSPWTSVMIHELRLSADVCQRMPQFQLYLTACLPLATAMRRRPDPRFDRPARGRL